MNKRDAVEDFLLKRFSNITPFNPENSTFLEKYKNNNFGFSSVGFALYSNGHNLRGQSTNYKYGLVYKDSGNVFSLGYFRKENDGSDEDGYLFFVAPSGRKSVKKIKEIIDILSLEKLPIRGFYIRYVDLNKYIQFLNLGGFPIKENPWHPEAAEEDETFTNSLVKIDNVLSVESGILRVKTIHGLSKNSKKKIKYAYARFENFLNRKSSKYYLVKINEGNLRTAVSIIKAHFNMLKKAGKDIGSSPEDHFNAVDKKMLLNSQVHGYIGYFDDTPVSVFIGESISKETFALYTPFTLRDPETLKKFIDTDEDGLLVGITAMPTYAYILLLAEVRKLGFTHIDLGGSEIADLNRFKRQLGGESRATYWVYFPNQS